MTPDKDRKAAERTAMPADDLYAALKKAEASLSALSALAASYPRPSNDPHGHILLNLREHARFAAIDARAVLAAYDARQG
jgi:hypothetical protein